MVQIPAKYDQIGQMFGNSSRGPVKHSGCGSCGLGKIGGEESRCGNGLEKIYPTTAVRFGYMRYIGEFSHIPDMKFTCGAKVVIQTKRGLEIGEQVSLTCSGCDKSVTRDQMREWVDSCGEDAFVFDAGRIIREATAGDLAENSRICVGNPERARFAQNVVDHQGLLLKIVECESLFGGERIIFFFSSPERIDFRGIVRDLAKEYRTRIEMRQIGARDEARLLADYETCGREVCCKVFLKTLKPISMRMAKMQKATLDPSQVSGRCGRLKCCLRYEHESYEELDKRLPRTGVRIRTEHGNGVVVNRQILTQLVQIRTDEEKLITVAAEDIIEVGARASDQRSSITQPPKEEAPGTQEKTAGTGDNGDSAGLTEADDANQSTATDDPASNASPLAPTKNGDESGSSSHTDDEQKNKNKTSSRRSRGKHRRRGRGPSPGDKKKS